jgi:peptide methionine sulfoxide reductase MsrA
MACARGFAVPCVPAASGARRGRLTGEPSLTQQLPAGAAAASAARVCGVRATPQRLRSLARPSWRAAARAAASASAHGAAAAPTQPRLVPQPAQPAQSRRAALAAACAAAALMLSRGAARALAEGDAAAPAAPALAVATFAGGDYIFLENVFDNLRYAGVKDVIIGYVGPERVRAVKVLYNAQKISYEKLLREYWKSVRPTQADGQFDARGAANASVVWAATPEQRLAAESSRDTLQRSGVFGAGLALVTPVLDGPAEGAFEPAPESERGFGRRDAKRLEELRKKTGRTAYYDSLWGLSTFCSGRVCGYVRFAKGCTDECLDVFPEYRDQPGAFQS